MSTNLKILLIEDDTDDIELLEEALKDNNVTYSLELIMQGDKVQPWLDKEGEHPDIIILDFNIPKLHGREILQLIKSSDFFKKVPLIVLTTSAAKEDLEYSLAMGADHFITKPSSIMAFNNAIQTIISTVKQHSTKN